MDLRIGRRFESYIWVYIKFLFIQMRFWENKCCHDFHLNPLKWWRRVNNILKNTVKPILRDIFDYREHFKMSPIIYIINLAITQIRNHLSNERPHFLCRYDGLSRHVFMILN